MDESQAIDDPIGSCPKSFAARQKRAPSIPVRPWHLCRKPRLGQEGCLPARWSRRRR